MEREYHLFEVEDNGRDNRSESNATVVSSNQLLVAPLDLLEREMSTCWGRVEGSDCTDFILCAFGRIKRKATL